jgi:hypothetical protein
VEWGENGVMALENKSLEELTALKVQLLKRISSNPDHSGIERVELEDVQGWVDLRVKETQQRSLEPTFDKSD